MSVIWSLSIYFFGKNLISSATLFIFALLKPEILFLSIKPGVGSNSVGIFFNVSIGIFDSSIRFNSIFSCTI